MYCTSVCTCRCCFYQGLVCLIFPYQLPHYNWGFQELDPTWLSAGRWFKSSCQREESLQASVPYHRSLTWRWKWLTVHFTYCSWERRGTLATPQKVSEDDSTESVGPRFSPIVPELVFFKGETYVTLLKEMEGLFAQLLMPGRILYTTVVHGKEFLLKLLERAVSTLRIISIFNSRKTLKSTFVQNILLVRKGCWSPFPFMLWFCIIFFSSSVEIYEMGNLSYILFLLI